MKKGHFKINFIVVCLLALSLFVACNNNSSPPHEHVYEEAWQKLDDTHHVKKAVCEHTDEALKEEHNWNDVVEVISATTESEGSGTKTCKDCGHEITVTIPKLPVYKFADTYIIDRAYNGKAIEIDKSQIINSHTSEAVSEEDVGAIDYKAKDALDSSYEPTPPTDAGTYVVRVSVKDSSFTKEFTISKKELTGVLELPASGQYKGEEYVIASYDLKDAKLGVIPGETVTLLNIRTHKDAGEKVEVADRGTVENQNYKYASDFKILYTITPRTITTPITVTKQYDSSNEILYSNWSSVSDVLAVDKGNLELRVDVNDVNVGSGHSISYIEFRDKDGNETANYEIDWDNITTSITPRKLTMTKEYNHIYDGKNEIWIEDANYLDGGIFDDVELKVTMAGANSGASVQSAEFYIAIMGGGGEDELTDNYFIDKADVKVAIVPKKLEGSLNHQFVYNGDKDYRIDTLSGFTGFVNEGESIENYSLLVRFENKDIDTPAVQSLSLREKTNIESKNYYIAIDDVTLSRTPKSLKAKKIPTKEYDGYPSVSLLHGDLDGVMGSDQPILEVTMNSINVDAVHQSHKIIRANGSVDPNYTIADNDPNALKAEIKPRELTLQPYSIPSTGLKYRYFNLGPRNGAKGTVNNEIIKVKFENNKANWNPGDTISTISADSKFSVIDNTNYKVVGALLYQIKILKDIEDKGKLRYASSSGLSLVSTFTVTSESDVFKYTLESSAGNNYKIVVEKDGESVDKSKLTLVNSSNLNEILYLDADDLTFNAEGNVDLYIYNLPVGKYSAWYELK